MKTLRKQNSVQEPSLMLNMKNQSKTPIPISTISQIPEEEDLDQLLKKAEQNFKKLYKKPIIATNSNEKFNINLSQTQLSPYFQSNSKNVVNLLIPIQDQKEILQKPRNSLLQKKLFNKDFFSLNTPELTPEIKNDLIALKARNAIDRKRHYKRQDSKKLPTKFEVFSIILYHLFKY